MDEVCLSSHDVNDVKAWCDLEYSRSTSARNRTGKLPKGTPRIFCTNSSWSSFWPRDVLNDDRHSGAIARRVLWIDLGEVDVRKSPPAEEALGHGGSSSSSSRSLQQPVATGRVSASQLPIAYEDEEDVFALGGAIANEEDNG